MEIKSGGTHVKQFTILQQVTFSKGVALRRLPVLFLRAVTPRSVLRPGPVIRPMTPPRLEVDTYLYWRDCWFSDLTSDLVLGIADTPSVAAHCFPHKDLSHGKVTDVIVNKLYTWLY